jgi:hypothetical protein
MSAGAANLSMQGHTQGLRDEGAGMRLHFIWLLMCVPLARAQTCSNSSRAAGPSLAEARMLEQLLDKTRNQQSAGSTRFVHRFISFQFLAKI